MKFAVDSIGAKKIDDFTTQVIKVPAVVLMERAAYEVTAVMKRVINTTDSIIVICGPGNNGGDGIAAGRILSLEGYNVAFCFLGKEEKASEQTKVQLDIIKNLGLTIENNYKPDEYNIIIDAIFGVGLSRPVTGEYAAVIAAMNQSGSRIFSVDIPSGISADDGKVMGNAVKADYTVTFGFQKQGLLLYPGAEYAGKIIVADIGFPKDAVREAGMTSVYYETEDIRRIPDRKNYSNKGTYGKVLIIAGSKGMSGAANLSAKAAYKTGAGLVKILTAGENRIILQTSLPEALFAAYNREGKTREEWENDMEAQLNWASVIVIGPGLGRSETAKELVNLVIKNAKVPVIMDADALFILSEILNSMQTDKSRLEQLSDILREGTVLTPHLMELSRLMDIPVADIVNNIIDTASQCSYNSNLIYAIKDARTIVTKSGCRYLNVSGNNGMATGGSGDVLTGIIAALIAQGMEVFEAVCLAVFLHGLAGDAASKKKGTYSMMAGDIIEAIAEVIS